MIPRPLWRPVLATAAVALLLGAWELAADQAGARRMAPLGSGPPEQRLGAAVTLEFAPEAFHTTRLQKLGRLIKVEGRTVFMLDLPRRDAARLARNYWVAELRPWTP